MCSLLAIFRNFLKINVFFLVIRIPISQPGLISEYCFILQFLYEAR